MRFVSKAEHARIVCHLYDRPKVAADAVISRVVDEDCHCIGIFLDRFLNVVAAHAERDTEPPVNVRINVYRDCTAKYKGIDDYFLAIYNRRQEKR